MLNNPKNIRVVQCVPSVSAESSGPSYSVVRLCESLIAEGQDVTLATLDLSPGSPRPIFVKAFSIGLGPRRLGRSPAMKKWLDEKVMSNGVELIHSHGMWQMNAVYPGWYAKKGNVPLVVSPRGALSEWAMQNGSKAKSLFWSLLQRPSFENVACFHATAESEYEDIRRLGFHQPVAIIPNGIDTPTIVAAPEGTSRTLLFLGRLHPKKGLDILLPAWEAVETAFPEWRLVIVGSDNGHYGVSGYLDELCRQAQQLDLKRIEFLGELRGTEKMKAYQQADMFVLPTYSENFGLTVAEALAAGTPAIVTTGAPWAELDTCGAGWSIEIGVDPLIDCLRSALAQPRCVLREMGKAGQAWMNAEFSWVSIGHRMARTYEWLVGCGSRPEWVRMD